MKNRHSKIKEEFKTLEDLMFNNKQAKASSKKKKYFKNKKKYNNGDENTH